MPYITAYFHCRRNYQDPESPVSFTYSLVFNNTEPIIKQEIDDMIAANSEVYEFAGNKWTLVGAQWLLNELGYDEIKINISDYLINEQVTVPPTERMFSFIRVTLF